MTINVSQDYRIKNVINGGNFTKAQLARELGVSRAYITMIANEKRNPSQNIITKLKSIYETLVQNVNTNEYTLLTLNQPVGGSSPPRLTIFEANSTHLFSTPFSLVSILSSLLNKYYDFSLNFA